jgi:hypothetical protein
VSFIRVAQQVGLSLDEIRTALGSLPDNRTPNDRDRARLSTSWRPRIDQQIGMVAVVPIAALVVWAWRRGERNPFSTAVGCLVTVVLGYAVVGGKVALDPLLAMNGAVSRASIWKLVGRVDPLLASTLLSGVLVALLIGIVLDRGSRAPLSSLCGTALLVYLLGSRYLLPWYVAWALPVLALRWRTSVATITSAAAVALAVSYVGAPRLRSPGLYAVVHPFYTWALPAALASGLVWLAMTAVKAPGEPVVPLATPRSS